MVCIGCLGHSGDVRFVHFRQNKCDVGVDNKFNFPQKNLSQRFVELKNLIYLCERLEQGSLTLLV